MRFADIIAMGDLKKALVGMADSGRVPHAMLLHENDGGGALALVLAFLEYLHCKERHDGDSCGQCISCRQHSKLIYPDIRFTFPVTSGTKVSGAVKDLTCDAFQTYWRELVLDNPYFVENDLSAAMGFEKKQGVIAVAEGKAILQKLSLAGISDGYRAIVMYLPERMNPQTANMLLKAIEEPADKTLFILITHAPEEVLQTIASRCQMMRVPPLSREEVSLVLRSRGIDAEQADLAASFAGGSVGVALRNLSESSGSTQVQSIFHDLLEAIVERDYLAALEAGEAVSALDSREKQKVFLTFAGESLRKIFMLQQGMESVAGVMPSEGDILRDAARRCSPTFCRRGIAAIDRAALLLDRNVAQKVILANLVNRLFVSV